MKRELQGVESCKINSHAPAGSLFSVKPVLSYKNLHSRRSFSWEEAAQVTVGHLQHPAFMRTLPCLLTCTRFCTRAHKSKAFLDFLVAQQ